MAGSAWRSVRRDQTPPFDNWAGFKKSKQPAGSPGPGRAGTPELSFYPEYGRLQESALERVPAWHPGGRVGRPSWGRTRFRLDQEEGKRRAAVGLEAA